MSESRYLSKMGTLCLITAVSTRKLEESAEGKRRKQGQLGTQQQGQAFDCLYYCKQQSQTQIRVERTGG